MRNATSDVADATSQPAASRTAPVRSSSRSSKTSKARPRSGEQSTEMSRNIVHGIWPNSREAWNVDSNCGARSG